MVSSEEKQRRKFGQHFTSADIFEQFILPKIRDRLSEYIFVDLFAGKGNLILPLLKCVVPQNRLNFFQQQIFLFDVQPECVEKCIENAEGYGIPREIAVQNITQRDTLRDYPEFLLHLDRPILHITNPPYLYLGYIVKTAETQKYLDLFTYDNAGYQDLYQIALINDLRHGLEQLIYIIPSNFLYGNSVSNKIRDDFLPWYRIDQAHIFEKKIFEFTGTNVILCFFSRKNQVDHEKCRFTGEKLGLTIQNKEYVLDPNHHYKAGDEFEDFTNQFKTKDPLLFSYYLYKRDLDTNQGNNSVQVIDANDFHQAHYQILNFDVNDVLYQKVRSNGLWVRTVDTGRWEGRAGLYVIRDSFGVDGIMVSKATYRTHPIQLFFDPPLNEEDQKLLRDYFNLLLEYLRDTTDSEFMTTYKYSGAEYTRKYFGLSQAKKLITTFPIKFLTPDQRGQLKSFVDQRDQLGLIQLLSTIKNQS